MSKSYYSTKAVSSSSLKWFEKSPLYFKMMLDEEISESSKPWLDLGKAVHCAILEPNEFDKLYSYVSFETPRSAQAKAFCDLYVKEYNKTKSHKISLSKAFTRNYKVEGKSGDKILSEAEKMHEKHQVYISYLMSKEDKSKVNLSDKQKKVIDNALQNIKLHKLASKLVFNDDDNLFKNVDAYNELELYWEYPIEFNGTKVDCKSMLDRIIIDHDNKTITIVDLKTTSDISGIYDSIKNYRYDRQLAFYAIAFSNHFSKIYPDKNIAEYDLDAYIVFIETSELAQCRVVKFDNNIIFETIPEVTNMIKEISWHINTNNWDYPRYYYENDGYETYSQ